MPLSEDQRGAMLAATREAAGALVEDIKHIESVVKNKTSSRADVRYLSTTLRRLLVYRDLGSIAAPRIGRINLLIPDNKPFLKLERYGPFRFFASGGAPLFGPVLRPLIYRDTQNFQTMQREQEIMNSVPQEATASARIEGFLSQRVLCSEGQWVTREDVIKFVANVASSAHSDTPASPVEILIAKIRNVASATSDGTNVTVKIRVGLTDAPVDVTPEFQYRPDAIDVVFHEIMSAGHYLLMSPDISKLIDVIRVELA